MNEDDYIHIIPREVLVKQATSAIASLAGGVLLMVMTMGLKFRIPGMILSIASLVIGLGALFSKDREAKRPGLILTIAGLLGTLIQFGPFFVRPFAVFILGFGAMGLFASGIIKGIKFLWGLKSRR